DVSQPQHGGSVGDHGDRVALDGQPPGVFRTVRDGQAHARHTRGVGPGEVVPVTQVHLGVHLELSAQVQQEGRIGDVPYGHAVQIVQALAHFGDVRLVAGVGRNVDHELGIGGFDHVHGGHG